MKALILFATKSGATKECADILAEKFNCPAYDLAVKTPDIASFDVIILGTGVRMGKIYKPVSDFIRKNIDQIAQKRLQFSFATHTQIHLIMLLRKTCL